MSEILLEAKGLTKEFTLKNIKKVQEINITDRTYN